MDRDASLELQRRGVSAFLRMLGRGSDGASTFERDGVLAAIVPTCPERSVLNSVAYRDAAALEAALDELTAVYDDAGVRAWTVWTPETDRDAAELLEGVGHRFDAAPAAMDVRLAGLVEPEPGDLDWDAAAAPQDVGRINDLAYGFEVGSFGSSIANLPAGLPARLYQARVDGEPASALITFDEREDCGIFFVGTLKEHRGLGLARRLLHIALAEARERGLRTSSLQSTKLGRPVYERLGYRAVFALEMWERRK